MGLLNQLVEELHEKRCPRAVTIASIEENCSDLGLRTGSRELTLG